MIERQQRVALNRVSRDGTVDVTRTELRQTKASVEARTGFVERKVDRIFNTPNKTDRPERAGLGVAFKNVDALFFSSV